jgi:hypothetical protein
MQFRWYNSILNWADKTYQTARNRVNAIRNDPGLLWEFVPDRIRRRDPTRRDLERKLDLATRNLASAVNYHTEQQRIHETDITERDEKIHDLQDDLTVQAEAHKAELTRAVDEVERRLAAEKTETIRQLNAAMWEEVRTREIQIGGLRQAVDAHRETIRDLRDYNLIGPVLRIREAENPEMFAGVNGLYLNRRLEVVYATQAFQEMTGIPESRILADTELSRAFSFLTPGKKPTVKSKLELEFGGKKYHIKQRSYQITDNEGETIGTFVHLTNIDQGLLARMFSGGRKQARMQYAAVREMIKSVREAVAISTPKTSYTT